MKKLIFIMVVCALSLGAVAQADEYRIDGSAFTITTTATATEISIPDTATHVEIYSPVLAHWSVDATTNARISQVLGNNEIQRIVLPRYRAARTGYYIGTTVTGNTVRYNFVRQQD